MIYKGKDIYIEITEQSLEVFKEHRQKNQQSLEAGGQLFARKELGKIIVSHVTPPRKKDKRTRSSFHPDIFEDRKDIKRLIKKDLHFVGSWHTHPEGKPTPSGLDISSMKSCFIESKHKLRYMIMVIVGTQDFPEGLTVSLHNTRKHIKCRYLSSNRVNVKAKKIASLWIP